MVAVTYGAARGAVDTTAKSGRAEIAAPRKNWFARFIDAVIESRMRQARREIRMYTRLLPYTVDEHGNRHVKTDTGDMPLGGW